MRLYKWLIWINFFFYVLAVPAWIYASMTIWSKFEREHCFSNWVDITQFVNMMLMYCVYWICAFTPLIVVCCSPCICMGYLAYRDAQGGSAESQANLARFEQGLI
jgi:hypothetical protein